MTVDITQWIQDIYRIEARYTCFGGEQQIHLFERIAGGSVGFPLQGIGDPQSGTNLRGRRDCLKSKEIQGDAACSRINCRCIPGFSWNAGGIDSPVIVPSKCVNVRETQQSNKIQDVSMSGKHNDQTKLFACTICQEIYKRVVMLGCPCFGREAKRGPWD